MGRTGTLRFSHLFLLFTRSWTTDIVQAGWKLWASICVDVIPPILA